MRLGREDRPVSWGVALLAGAVAILVAFPLAWLVIAVGDLEVNRALELLLGARSRSVLWNSLQLVIGVTAGSVFIGVPLAILTVRTDLPYRRLWTVAVALPLVVPSYVGAFALVSAFGPRGRFQDLLAPFGIEELPSIYGLWGTILVLTLYTYPYVYLTTRASLLSADHTRLEAARTLNRGPIRALTSVTLPQIAPGVAAGALLAGLYAIGDFGTPAFMQLPVFTQQIYVELTLTPGQDLAAVLAIQLLFVVAVILGLEHWIRSRGNVQSGAARRSGRPLRLGRWRWPAMGFPAAVVGLSLAVPLWILGSWVLDPGTLRRPGLAFELGHAVNSTLVALLTALIAVIAAVPVAYYAARSESTLGPILERVTYLGFAVPGVVLGFALVYFGSNYATGLYFTLPLLVYAYAVRFLPQAVGTIFATTRQVDEPLLQAARTLGAGPIRAFRSITLPLIAPGLIAGAALVFLTTMKELPITLLLRPHDFDTIVTQIWRAHESGLYQYAAVPALLLIGISGLSMAVLLSQGRLRYR